MSENIRLVYAVHEATDLVDELAVLPNEAIPKRPVIWRNRTDK